MNDIRIGIIGGSGLYDLEGVELLEELDIDTPFGKPSDRVVIGALGDRRFAFIPRHGRGHVHNPSQVPVRANIWALKKLGVFWLTSVSAVGSLKEEIAPCDFVVPDQLIDRTKSRVNTFFDEIAVHVGFSYPFDPDLATVLVGDRLANGKPESGALGLGRDVRLEQSVDHGLVHARTVVAHG